MSETSYLFATEDKEWKDSAYSNFIHLLIHDCPILHFEPCLEGYAKLSMMLACMKSKISCPLLFQSICNSSVSPHNYCRRAQMLFSVVIWEEISTNLVCTFISIAILRFEIIEDNVHVMLNSARDDQIMEKRLIKWDVKTIQSLLCLSAKQVGIYIKDVLQDQRTCLDSLDMT